MKSLEKRYYTLKTSRGYHEKGVASWYGTKFHGKRTSSGEPYDMYAMTAAHKTLPLPSYLEVTNLDNGKRVIVKVNDRGPFHGNRLIDLSYSAAVQLDIVAKGTGRVELKTITPEKVAAESRTRNYSVPVEQTELIGIYLQVGAFSTVIKAEQLRAEVQQEIGDAILIMPLNKPSGILYRVRVGPLINAEYGHSLANRLFDLGFTDAHIVIE